MKKFLFSLLFIIALFCTDTFAQISVQNFTGTDTWKINMTYDVDSAATLTSRQFSMDDFDGGISATHPATFYFDNATDGAPATTANLEIILWGVYNGSSYTYPLDTVLAHATNQGVDDSLGVLTLNTWSAPVYYITINNTGGNASGVLQITFPLREHGKTSELDGTH
jgi:hypothetical protein